MPEETIAAIATPPGKGGVAIVRMSGKDAFAIAEKMFSPAGKRAVRDFAPYRLYPGQIAAEGFSDYGLCVFFRAPHSYTGEDVAEFQCHGGENVARGILKRCFALGARGAERGEFTRRAFLNGKLSLASAEGLADMINGESDAEVRAGYLLYGEKLTGKVRACQDELKELLAGADAAADYPEEDLEERTAEELRPALGKIRAEISALASGYGQGKKVKSGVTVALCGKPNTGKSSLLNRLLGYEKAIVSDIAGTTRDAVEGTIEIGGVRFNLYDTAGIRESGDTIESIGIRRAENIVRSADIVVLVSDETEGAGEDARLFSLIGDKPLVRLFNKSDLGGEAPPGTDAAVSALTGEGMEKLREILYEKGFGARSEDAAFLVEERHFKALVKAREALLRAEEGCGVRPLELVAADMTAAWETLGEITGETASEAVIEEIFSKFCVGK